jgi:hypothetical protein
VLCVVCCVLCVLCVFVVCCEWLCCVLCEVCGVCCVVWWGFRCEGVSGVAELFGNVKEGVVGVAMVAVWQCNRGRGVTV